MSVEDANAGPSQALIWGGTVGRRVMSYVLPFVFVAAVWQIAAQFFPPYLFPSLVDVFKRCVDILTSWSQLRDVLATVGRITLLQSLWCVPLTLWDEDRRRLVSFGRAKGHAAAAQS